VGGPEMAAYLHGGLDRAPKPPALVTPRGTRGAPRLCVPAGTRSAVPRTASRSSIPRFVHEL